MASIDTLFATRLYREDLSGAAVRRLNREIAAAARLIAEEDTGGRRWCEESGYPGYTSYGSLNDLTVRAPPFADLERRLDPHVDQFARVLELDLGRRRLRLDSLWVNVLEPAGFHSAHIHPHAVVSGTYYVEVPKGAGAIRFEDPRLALFMAAPPKKAKARLDNRAFVTVEPRAGTLLLWESWLRHEVGVSRAAGQRISVSFNYALVSRFRSSH